MQIINGREIRDEILAEVASGVKQLDFTPIFCDILVGDDPVSAQYVRMKGRTAESVGIKFHNANFKADISTEELIEEIKKINQIPDMCGVIVQLPLPAHIDRALVLNAVEPRLDVDCLGEEQSALFYDGHSKLGFPTALACIKILDSLNLELKDKNIVVLGQGSLVGKPVSALLEFRGLNPKIVTRSTEKGEEIVKNADVLISGIGKGAYIKGDMLKNGVVLVDAGTSEMDGGILGDIDTESVSSVASAISPVPGGVGPVTVAMLMKNVLEVAKDKSKR